VHFVYLQRNAFFLISSFVALCKSFPLYKYLQLKNKHKTKVMNSSAFKANVHLNIVSFGVFFFLSFLYVRPQKTNSLAERARASLAQPVAEVHFVKMQPCVWLRVSFCPRWALNMVSSKANENKKNILKALTTTIVSPRRPVCVCVCV